MYCEVEVLKLHFFFFFFPFSFFLSLFFLFHDHHPDIFWRAFHVLFLNCRCFYDYCCVCVCVNVHLDMSLSLSIRSWFLLTLRFRLTSSVVDISLELKEEILEAAWNALNLFYDESFFLFHFGGGGEEMKGRFLDCNFRNETREIEVERRKYAFSCGDFICFHSKSP